MKTTDQPIVMALVTGPFAGVVSEFADDSVFVSNFVRLALSVDGDHWDAQDSSGGTPGYDGAGCASAAADSVRFFAFDTERDLHNTFDAIHSLVDVGLLGFDDHEWVDVTAAFIKVTGGAEVSGGGIGQR